MGDTISGFITWDKFTLGARNVYWKNEGQLEYNLDQSKLFVIKEKIKTSSRNFR